LLKRIAKHESYVYWDKLLTSVGDAIYFSVEVENRLSELWSSDGTAAGTGRVAFFSPAQMQLSKRPFVAINGTLFFDGYDVAHGYELWRTPLAPAPRPGDYDRNAVVDGADFLRWQRELGSTVAAAGSGADGDGSEWVGSEDLAVWRAAHTEAAAVSAASQSAAADSVFAGGDFTAMFAPVATRPRFRPLRRG
jgi:ELWxxDGT repeat protein